MVKGPPGGPFRGGLETPKLGPGHAAYMYKA